MLRNMSLRWKFLSIISIPMILLVAVSGYLGVQATNTARQSHAVEKMAQMSVQFTALVHATQVERDLSEAYLTTHSPAVHAQLVHARGLLDSQVTWLRQQTAPGSPMESVSPVMRTDLAKLVGAYTHLSQVRQAVDHQVPSLAPLQLYNQIIAGELTMPEYVASQSSNVQVQRELHAYEAALQINEYVSEEQNILAAALSVGTFATPQSAAKHIPAPSFNSYRTTAAKQRAWEGVYSLEASPAELAPVQRTLNSPAAATALALRFQAFAWPNTHTLPVSKMATWNKVTNQMLAGLASVQPVLAKNLETVAHNQYVAARNRQYVIVSVTVLGIIVALALSLALVRRMIEPLVALTKTARDVSEELPRMVERMQEPGAAPNMTVAKIPVDTNDEIGRLSEAFNTVNEVTVKVAQDQAALRGSIADMFVNVARRNQALLGRQLSFIDSLEQKEEDPTTLENLFRLDHLATRMRRNAESLLVLAGIDSTRRLRRPVPLSDIIRTAVGEIESYDRIDLSVNADPRISGRVALGVAHMLAELLENSTNYSNPDSRVQVSCRWHRDGRALIAIADQGLGFEEAELAEANERLAKPPVAEGALSQRLGFMVVGRLAHKLGAKVSLAHNPVGGTIANILLPTDIMEDTDGPKATPQAAEGPKATPQAAPSRPTTPPERFAAPVATEPAHNGQVVPAAVPEPPAPAQPTVVKAAPSVSPSGLPTRTTAAAPAAAPAPAAQAPATTQPLPPRQATPAPAPLSQPAPVQPTAPAPAAPAAKVETPAAPAPTAPAASDGPTEQYVPALASGIAGAQQRSLLSRRTPGEHAPAEEVATDEPGGPEAAPRNPTEVRGLLNAFRSGVERGRSHPGSVFDGEEV